MPPSNNILKNNVIVRKAFSKFLSLLLFGFELSELFLDRQNTVKTQPMQIYSDVSLVQNQSIKN